MYPSQEILIFAATLFLILVFGFFYRVYIYLLDKKYQKRTERNVKKRMILANYETILDMDEQERALMQQTFVNTLNNASPIVDPKLHKVDKKLMKIRDFKERTVKFFFNKKEQPKELEKDVIEHVL